MLVNKLKLVNGKVEQVTEDDIDVNIELSNEEKISKLCELLSQTDYIACKIAEGAATVEEYTDVILQRKKWREEIRELET